MEFNGLQSGYRDIPDFTNGYAQGQPSSETPILFPSYGAFQPPQTSPAPQSLRVQPPARERDAWSNDLTPDDCDRPTPSKRRRGWLYNGSVTEHSSAAEAQTIYPSPMSIHTQTPHPLSVRDGSEQAECARPVQHALDSWQQKPYDYLDPSNADLENPETQQDFTKYDEDSPVIHMRQPGGYENPPVTMSIGVAPGKRMSNSSVSISTAGEFSSVDDVSTSEGISHPSDWESALDPASSWMSPMASPRHSQAHLGHSRRGSRVRGSPATSHNVRPSPYGMGSDRAKRWSIAGASAPSSSVGFSNGSVVNHPVERYPTHPIPRMPYQSAPAYNLNVGYQQQPQTQNVYYSHSGYPQAMNGVFYPQPELQAYQMAPRPLPSQGLFRMLHSNGEGQGHAFASIVEHSAPPDLYHSLNEPPCDPPEEDMHPSDPDLVPHEQDLRFTGDLYTPKWVRGHGNKREGWCGLCKPGRWLVLKNSAFWYDKSFTHGVSAATGAAFQGPQETRRTEGNADVWEGHCGSCGDWVSLVSSKKKGTTWFRHAYKCHTHPKVKDAPKRRRETSASMRVRAASNVSLPTTASSPPAPIKHDGAESPASEPVPDTDSRAHFQAPQQHIPGQMRTGGALDGFAGML
ncbi:MAG: hypothetical protein M1820_009833 [Bogoriella megaspora]|nr:MAG: hypothetical protein M1820_009833 [Bogoriella megaspora]